MNLDPTKEKVKAIQEAPALIILRNYKLLQSFPASLLRRGSPWCWNPHKLRHLRKLSRYLFILIHLTLPCDALPSEDGREVLPQEP